MSALYPECLTEDEAAPANTRLAATRAAALHVDLAPRFGTKAWKREEDILYRGIRAFRCNVCKRVVYASDGGADDMPDACSKCWCDAHGVKVSP